MLDVQPIGNTGVGDSPTPAIHSPSHADIVNDLVDNQCAWVGRHQSGWQFGEQGVIDAIVDHLSPDIPDEDRWVVEFGGGNTPSQVTVANIAKRPDWRVLLIEGNENSAKNLSEGFTPNVLVIGEMVSVAGKGSIDERIERIGCSTSPAVMVVDVDSIDYYIVKGMKATPYVLCVETMDLNHSHSSGEPFVPPIEECGVRLKGGFNVQANAAAMDILMHGRGYKLVFRSRVNSIYVRGDIAPKLRKTCLNLGCGPIHLLGHENIDIKDGVDIRKLPHKDNSVDEVYASHVLEHFSIAETDAILKEWVRVLKPGGIIRIAVPDMRKVMAGIASDDPATTHDQLTLAMFGGGKNSEDLHRSGFVRETLMTRMYANGIGSIQDFKPFAPDCSTDKNSLNLQGIKRWFGKLESPRITMVLNQPRLAFTGHEKSLLMLAQKLKFEIQESYGSFWDRDMTLATQAAINKYNPDLIVFSDYDSMMEPSDLITLIETINNDPTMAAIGAVQPSRHHDAPLVLDPTIDYSGDITKVRFQHFGLMVIRREVFDELAQPWFWSVPGKDASGEWDWSAWARSDADITFWRNLEMLGFNVYQHNKVNIGHIIQAVKYVRDKGKGVQLIPIENYWRHGKPKDAVFVPSLYIKQPEVKKPEEPKAT